LAVVALAALTAAWRYTPLSEFLAPQRIHSWSRAARETKWAPLVLVAAYTPAAFLLFPRPLLTLIVVVAFGAWLGFACAIAGVMLAALATYYAGRLLPRSAVRRLAGDALDKAKAAVRDHVVVATFAANMTPVPPFGVQGMIAGAMRLNVLEYSIGTFLSVLPGALALTTFGHQINAALEDPSRVNYWVVGAVLAAFGIFVFFARRWARTRD